MIIEPSLGNIVAAVGMIACVALIINLLATRQLITDAVNRTKSLASSSTATHQLVLQLRGIVSHKERLAALFALTEQLQGNSELMRRLQGLADLTIGEALKFQARHLGLEAPATEGASDLYTADEVRELHRWFVHEELIVIARLTEWSGSIHTRS